MRVSRFSVRQGVAHLVLLVFTASALAPIALIALNSFKRQNDILTSPFSLPFGPMFSLAGYEDAISRGLLGVSLLNSAIVSIVSTALIVIFGAMCAWAIAQYRFKGRTVLLLFFAVGVMVPVKLGTIPIVGLMRSLYLTDTLTSLILVYVAQGLPFTIIVFESFISRIPEELVDSARCDGVSEWRILFTVAIPLIGPAFATVAIFVALPIWNDLWFPLVLTSGHDNQTVTLGVQKFIGQYATNWSAVFATLSLAALPPLLLYVALLRLLSRGLLIQSR